MNHLIGLNGVCGDKQGSKIIKSVTEAVISSSLLSTYTWTGRSKSSDEEKKKLSSKVNVVDLIYDVIKAYDGNYSKQQCKTDLIYKVCKYAHLG